MSVDSKHVKYTSRIDQWTRCRDTVEGSDAVKKARGLYLPILSGQTTIQYSAYLMRALFFGATGRTVQGLKGAVFRKPPDIEFTSVYEEYLENITTSGMDIEEFSRQVIQEILVTGRLGILVDPPKQEGFIRAYAALYSAENITNWRTAKIEGKDKLVLVVLRELYEERHETDIFESKFKVQFRVLRLENLNGARVYIQEVYRKKKAANGGEVWAIEPSLTIRPLKSGQPLDTIPFQFINSMDLTTNVEKPPLLAMVDVNLSHFRTSADLEHGAHYTALPTPWAAGFNTRQDLHIGSGKAWVTDEVNAKVGYLEYTGQGLSALRELKRDKEQQMAVLGARLLEDQKKAVESADTLRIRQSGEAGALTSIVMSVSTGIENVLKAIAWWSGATDVQLDDIRYKLNEDFSNAKLTPQELSELMKTWQAGGISQDTFLWNLKQGEILPDDITVEDEKDKIDLDGGGIENSIEIIESVASTNVVDIR